MVRKLNLPRRSLRIIYWNAEGLKSQMSEFKYLLSKLDVDIFLINETHLTPQDHFVVRNYLIYRTDSPLQYHRGTAVIIKDSIPHRQVDLQFHPDLEATGVMVNTNAGEILFTAIYAHPGPPFPLQHLQYLTTINRYFLLAGDYNARSHLWNSLKTCSRGRRIANFVQQNGFSISAPAEPTHFPYNPRHIPDTIDFAILDCPLPPLTTYTLLDFQSDHAPVFLDLSAPFSLLNNRPHYPLTITNWSNYKDDLEVIIQRFPDPQDETEAEMALDIFTNTLQEVHRQHTTTTKHVNKTPEEHTLIDLVRQKRKARKRWQLYRDRSDLQLCRRLAKSIKKELHLQFRDKLDMDLQEASDPTTLWKITKRFTRQKQTPISSIQGANGTVYTSDEKASEIAQSFESRFQPNENPQDPHFTRDVESRVNSYLKNPPTTAIAATNTQEVTALIKDLSTRKSPGFDKITPLHLKNLPNTAIIYLTILFNCFLQAAAFPSRWKNAKIITIPKPGKNPTYPQNLRPISLLSTISKLYERILLRRIWSHIEPNNLVPLQQFGFRAGHSTVLQLQRVVEHITESFQNQKHTIAIFLDVKEAFDRVWHSGLLSKLIRFNFPDALTHCIADYLTSRTFQVFLEATCSPITPVTAGVPQGSVLGPILYLLYTADFPIHRSCQAAFFADDTLVYYSAKSLPFIKRILQGYVRQFEDWFTKWRININTAKTQAVIFSKRRVQQPQRICIFGDYVNYAPSVKYLGVHLDSKLTFKQHIDVITAKAHAKLLRLYPLYCSPELSIKQKKTFYCALIRSAILYACETWGFAAKTHIQKLQRVQNRAARMMTGAPRDLRITQLHEDLELEAIHNIIIRRMTHLYGNYLQHHANPLLNNLGDYIIIRPHKRPRAALTN